MNTKLLYTKIEDRVFELIGDISDYHPEDLDRDMSFEADLRLDSIKMVQLSSSLPDLFSEYENDEWIAELAPQKMAQIQTIGELLDIVKNYIPAEDAVAEIESNDTPETIGGHDEKGIVEIDPVHDQYFFLVAQMAVSTCSLCSRIRLKAPLRPDLLKKTWEDLLQRHPMLRASFFVPSGTRTLAEYRMHILTAPVLPEVSIRDLRDLDSDQKEQVLEEEEKKWKAYEWDVRTWPLYSFLAFQLEDSEFEIFFNNTHLISDGISNQIVIREFVEVYGAYLDNQEPAGLSYSLDDYQNVVKIINSWDDTSELEAFETFLQQQGRGNFVWNPLSSEIRNIHPLVKSPRYAVDEQITLNLMAKTKEWRISIASFMASAYLLTIRRFDDHHESVIVNIPTSGRIYPGIDNLEADAFAMVGCFAQNLALSFRLPEANEDLATLLHRVHHTIQQALTSGYDRAQMLKMRSLNTLPLTDGKLRDELIDLIRSEVKSNLYLSFIGQTGIRKQYGQLEIADYRALTTTASNTLDTIVEMIHGRIQFTINHDEKFYSDAFIKDFGEELVRQVGILSEVIPEPETAVDLIRQKGDNRIIEEQIRKIGESILHISIDKEAMNKDLEAELGMDSLERIRIVTKIRDSIPGVNALTLMECRSLAEMAGIIGPKKSPGVLASVLAENQEMPYQKIIRQCKTRPNEIAIIYESTEMTYGELHSHSNRLAHYLRQHGIQQGSFVGLMTNRGPQMLIGLLGILKAGGTYIPIDPRYPAGRITYMIDHAKMSILLTEEVLSPLIKECTQDISALRRLVLLKEGMLAIEQSGIEVVSQKSWMESPDGDIDYVNTPDDLMVVLYTSGSTGKPKGVMLNHTGYTNRIRWHQKVFQLSPGERVAQKTSCSFDISVWELFWPLMEGGILCPVENDIVKNPWRLAQWLNDTKINIMHFVPSMFGEFVTALEGETTAFPDLRWLIFSGEALPIPYIQKWIDKHGLKTGLANLYGPTEASIDVTCHIIEKRPADEELRIPIGKAIDNTYMLILDKDMNILPQGQEGELWIGGIQLAKGYLKDPEKTDAAFKPNPFPDIDSEYLYRTGDLAAELPNGSIDYHGRIDNQVKIRGYRVELGEIEAVINNHDAVNESGVLAIDYGPDQKRLAAWVSGEIKDAKQLKEYIAQRLTDYMIPHTFYFLESLPKTPNGKLDRKALKAQLTQQGAKEENAPAATAGNLEELPLGPAQKWLVEYFDPPYEWSGYTRFSYHDYLDIKLFNKAANHLMQVHSVLRTIFVQKNGTLVQQIIHPEHPFLPEVYDGSHLTLEQREKEIRKQIEKNQKFRIDQWPLFKIVIIKVSESCYDMLFIGHHLISDLVSNQALFKEFWKIYSYLLAGKRPESASALSYADFVGLLVEEDRTGALDKHRDYWISRYPSDKSPFAIPYDYQKGDNIEQSSATERFTLGRNDTDSLLTDIKSSYRCNLYYIMLAPLYKLLYEWTQNERVIVSHRMHGRNIGQKTVFMESIGNFAVHFPVLLEIQKEADVGDIIHRIQKAFEELPMNGITFDYISDRLPPEMYPDNKLTPVRANYLGNRTAPPSRLFEFNEADQDQRLSSPEQKRISQLECFFFIKNGDFHLDMEYSNNFHKKETIQDIGKKYMELMRSMIHR